MTNVVFEDIVTKQIDYCKELLLRKGQGYADEETDRLRFFKTAAELEQVPVKQALFGMMTKHLVSLADMCRLDNIRDENIWTEKISDTINYCLLLKALVYEDRLNLAVSTKDELAGCGG